MSGIGLGQVLSLMVRCCQEWSRVVRFSQVWSFMWAKLIHFTLHLTIHDYK